MFLMNNWEISEVRLSFGLKWVSSWWFTSNFENPDFYRSSTLATNRLRQKYQKLIMVSFEVWSILFLIFSFRRWNSLSEQNLRFGWSQVQILVILDRILVIECWQRKEYLKTVTSSSSANWQSRYLKERFLKTKV